MACLVFETQGLIDLRAFTLMGVSAKPGTKSPIGKFGTGLKYSVASLVRWDTNPVIWIGEDKYTFKKSADSFRGQNFYGVTMVRQRFGIGVGRYTKLPYTTLYGREWKPWMVYRELEANTRDEQGTTYVTDAIGGSPGVTRIVIDNRDVMEAQRHSDKVFLPDGMREGTGVQVIDRESNALYWRGLKVYDLPKKSQSTYNILTDVSLTEDRTLASEWLARHYIGNWVLTQADSAQVQEFVTADEEYWEHEFDLDQSTEPSPAFKETLVRRTPTRYAYSRSSERVFQAWDDRPRTSTRDLLDAHPGPWRVIGDSVVDNDDTEVFRAPYGYQGNWRFAAEEIVLRINGGKI